MFGHTSGTVKNRFAQARGFHVRRQGKKRLRSPGGSVPDTATGLGEFSNTKKKKEQIAFESQKRTA